MSWCISNSKSAYNYTGKNVQLFHETDVNQLLGDPNYEANQWLRVSYCQKTKLHASCAQAEDSEWGELMYHESLMTVNI